MIDPRPAAVERRLAGVRRILVVAGAKGGVGKTTCAVLAALRCAAAGLRTTLFDLDFHGACCHTLLGLSPGLPREQGGILPVEAGRGLQLVTVASFAGDRPVPLRGAGASSALAELLAVTVWGERDLLVVDMPPGLGDLLLDVVRLVPRAEIVAVTTPSRLAVAVTARLLALLREAPVRVAGVLVNMARELPQPDPDFHVPILGFVPTDPELDQAAGSPDALAACAAARTLDPLIRSLLDRPPAPRFFA